MTQRLRGFAKLSPERRREVASLGGRTGGRHVFTTEDAQAAGRKGGMVSQARRAREVLAAQRARDLLDMVVADARALGMSTDEAIIRARDGSLPKNPIADDLILLLSLQSS
jgi:uncharacterized protein